MREVGIGGEGRGLRPLENLLNIYDNVFESETLLKCPRCKIFKVLGE